MQHMNEGDDSGTDNLLAAGAAVAVTGAAGFIGGRVTKLLRQHGIQVHAYARKRGGLGISPLRLEDAVAVDRALSGCCALVHCAFDFHDLAANLRIARVLGPICAARRIRLVLISTAAVYEPFPQGMFDETTPSERVGVPYSDTKIDIEQELIRQSRTLGLDVVILQPTLVYGPFCRQWTDSPARELLTGRVILPEDGQGVCNAVYVDDVCSAVIAAISADVPSGERFIISGPHVVTWHRFFSAMREALGTGAISCVPSVAGVSTDARMPRVRVASGGKAALLRMAVRMIGPQTRAKLKFVVRKMRAGGGEIVYLPEGSKLDLYASRGIAATAKARGSLGWNARVSFDEGMVPTAHYLREAFASEILRRQQRDGRSEGLRTTPASTAILRSKV